MNRINVLPEELARQIAAGEVVERPASVLKELLENSIDAGSTNIYVNFTADGREYLQVRDNGWGMTSQDLALAFERHATSKVRRFADIQGIKTLGFRGEALPSIAAVAKVTVESKEKGAATGSRIRLEGGQIRGQEPAGCPEGTSVTVTDLFFNTPARRKFLKSIAAETAKNLDLLSRLAMAHPGISFQVRRDDRLVLNTPGTGDLRQTVAQTLGVDTARQLLPVACKGQKITVEGLLGPSHLTRANRSQEIIYINGRYIKDAGLRAAVEEAYRGSLPGGKYPVFILNLTLDPRQVDVNIHPAKWEIRLDNSAAIHAELKGAAEYALARSFSVPSLKLTPPKGETPRETPEQTSPPKAPARYSQERLPLKLAPYFLPPPDARPEQAAPEAPKAAGEPRVRETSAIERPWPNLEPRLQFDATYIIAEGEGALYLIDQHAAHERIRYEKLLELASRGRPAAQELAVPLSLELTAAEQELLLKQIIKLRELGLTVEHLEGGHFILRSVPAGFEGQDGAELIRELIGRIAETKNPGSEQLLDTLLKLGACKGAVKAHQKLSYREMEELLNELAACRQPFNCPHGRPTMISFTSQELARQFKRT